MRTRSIGERKWAELVKSVDDDAIERYEASLLCCMSCDNYLLGGY